MKLLLGAFLSLCSLTGADGQEPIRFARTPDISPDGKLVAFSYLGDIWTVETIGGVARPVTMHEAHDINPVFSPDGRLLAFSSNRHGSYDVFVVPVHGGKPRRLTFDSAPTWSAAGRPTASRSCSPRSRGTGFPPASELYTVPAEGGPRAQARRHRGQGRRLLAEGRPDRLRPRAGHVVSQGLPRLVQRRHLDLQRRRHRTTAG